MWELLFSWMKGQQTCHLYNEWMSKLSPCGQSRLYGASSTKYAFGIFLTFWLNQTAKRKQFLVSRRPMLHGKFKSQYTLSISSSFLLLLSPSLEKWETPRYHASKISESRQSFLIQPDGHFHFRTTDKKPMGCRCVPDHECNHAPKIHTYHFFFLPYLQDQGLLWSKSFATMAT